MSEVHFIGGPLDGQTMPQDALWGKGSYQDHDTDSHYSRANTTAFLYTGPATPPNPAGPRPEVTVHGQKLMTLGQLQDFLDAARAAGYPEDHVPFVANSFSGRIRSLTAKSSRRTV